VGVVGVERILDRVMDMGVDTPIPTILVWCVDTVPLRASGDESKRGSH
jgi:hypothetical protein